MRKSLPIPDVNIQPFRDLPTRQVHLDFHTSEHIKGIGQRFDARHFQKALKLGRLNSITVFAKCHHGWSYYPTKLKGAFPHPHLKIDLLGKQIRAAHAIGVRAPIYMTVGWSANDAERHPDWVVRKRDGSIDAANIAKGAKPTDPRPAISWKYLDPTGAYKQLIIDQTAELCRLYPADGFFYDICAGPVSLSARRLQAMRAQGLDPAASSDCEEFRIRVWHEFMMDVTRTIQALRPAASIFFNGNAGAETDERLLQCQSHYELEDLPTTWGGYEKFPLRAKLFSEPEARKSMLAMSGKFHTNWGEFGGFKHPDAIRFEAASMIAWGARCSFGDQLHPTGEMDLETYRAIGKAYADVERIEEFGISSEPCANLALWSPPPRPGSSPADVHEHVQGVANMLLEVQRDFRVVREAGNLSDFQTIILPGCRFVDPPLAKQLERYLAAGGSLLVLGESALHPTGRRLMLDVGAKYLGPGRFDVDYTRVGRTLADGLVKSPFLNYESTGRYVPAGGRRLAQVHEPYFSRTYGQYCSHQNTPHDLRSAPHAGAIQRGRVILLPHALGRIYYRHGARVHRDLFANALRRLHKTPFAEVVMPSAGRMNVVHQPQYGRYVIHLLYGPPLQRGKCLVIEDLPPLHDVPLRLKLPKPIRRIHLPLEERALRAKQRSSNVVDVVVPRVQRHQVVVAEYIGIAVT